MTQHRQVWIIGLAAAVGLFPGCMHLREPSAEGFATDRKDRWGPAPISLLKGHDRTNELVSLEPDSVETVKTDGPAAKPAPPLKDTLPPVKPSDLLPPPEPQKPAVTARLQGYGPEVGPELSPTEVAASSGKDIAKPTLTPAVEKIDTTLPPAEPQRDPLAVAIEEFLRDHPQEALESLRHYDPQNREMIQRLLPMLAQLTRKKLPELSDDERVNLFQEFDGVWTFLRACSGLLIDRMCYCASVTNNGECQALPSDHAFHADAGARLGDPVQIFVQLRNLSSVKRGGYFETKLVSTVTIVDAGGAEVWKRDFTKNLGSLRSQTPRTDHFFNYNFLVPQGMPPGDYTLIVEVRDVTRGDSPREARRSLPFHIRG